MIVSQLLGLCIVALYLDVSEAAAELLLAHAIWSSGQTNPIYFCKNDAQKTYPWLQGTGALTKFGMIQQHKLGELIYDRYTSTAFNAFLSKDYNSRKIYVRSSDNAASIASGYSNLIGMYYDRPVHVAGVDYPDNTNWPKGFVPIPVHGAEPTQDCEVNGDSDCGDYVGILENILASAAYNESLEKYKDILSNITNICGSNITPFELWKLEKTSDVENHQKLTNIFNDELQKMLHDAYVHFETLKYTENARSLGMSKGGNLLWRITENMRQKDMIMIRSILANMNDSNALFKKSLTESNVVSILLELWMIDNVQKVRMLFYSSASASFDIVTEAIPGCAEEFCEIDNLYNFANTLHKETGSVSKKYAAESRSNWLPETSYYSSNESNNVKASNKDADGDELMFVQAVWRHGDRTPVAGFVCKNDVNQDAAWKQGFDQLTYKGMRQHMKFGSLIYDRYYKQMKFFSEKYSAAEIYVRSTDYNRTIISAISNLIGTYYNKGFQAGIDYPSVDEVKRWPQGYVPIPIHTIYRSYDPYADVPYSKCNRKTWLQSLALNSSEVQEVLSLNQDNYNKPQLFDVNLFNELRGLDIYAEKVKAGFLNLPYIKNMDLSIELPKIRGGPLLWHLIRNIQQKIECDTNNNVRCNALKARKYYIFSAHDITLNALFITLGCFDRIIYAGIPNYSAGVLLELWKSKDGKHSIRLLYHRGEYENNFEDITDKIAGCSANQKCPVTTFLKRSNPYLLPLSEVPQACANTETPLSPTSSSPPTASTTPKSTVTTSKSSSKFLKAFLDDEVTFSL
uniref:Histidine acid phosphatase n=1 Tax=Syphacia muris TaxID=451379 RepID=A0A0N5ASR1_9BILA